MTDRSGVEIDYCPECRGVWLDRGELDRILEHAAPTGRDDSHRRHHDDHRHHDHDDDHDDRRRDDHRDDHRDAHRDDRRYDERGGARRKRGGAFGALSGLLGGGGEED